MRAAQQAQILLVGDELVSGHRVNEIGPLLTNRLHGLGFEIRSLALLPDRTEPIAAAVSESVAARVELLIVCGGLGPTEDDVTREGVSEGLSLALAQDSGALQKIEEHYSERGRDVPETARRQARIPAGAELVLNRLGTAPGFLVRRDKTLVIALPGVPREFSAMFSRVVGPRLAMDFAGGAGSATRLLRVAGLGEVEVARRLEDEARLPENVKVKSLARPGEVELLVSARADDPESSDEAEARLLTAVDKVREILGEHVFGEEDETLVGVVRDLLRARGWSLSTAESCTGGLLGKLITDLAGSSSFYRGGVTVYADDEKSRLLGISAELLASCGAVSTAAAREMALACCDRLATDASISVTGIAGPGGGSADKPVGLVFVGVASPVGYRVMSHVFSGARDQIRMRAAFGALDELRRFLASLPPLGEETESQGEGPG